MTRETAIKNKEVILAFIDGHDIQCKDDDDTWFDASNPSFYSDKSYRVKPKEELVPMDFSDAERLIGKFLKYGHDISAIAVVTECNESGARLGTSFFTYADLLTHCLFIDGSPIGKLSE